MRPGHAASWPDLIAGVTTGVANIPDAMATAILAGANPVQGLYAIMIGTPLGAIFDRTGTTDEILGVENVFEATTILAPVRVLRTLPHSFGCCRRRGMISIRRRYGSG